jgi:hypothetical protein
VNGSRCRGSNQFVNHEDQFDMDSRSPTILAPGGSNHLDDDFLNTKAYDPISTQAQVPSSTQSPASAPASRKTSKSRKRKTISEFHEEYLAYKRDETKIYSAAMERNANRSSKCEEKYSVFTAMGAYQQLPDFDIVNFAHAIHLFINIANAHETFLSIDKAHRSEWIKMMIELYKSKE